MHFTDLFKFFSATPLSFFHQQQNSFKICLFNIWCIIDVFFPNVVSKNLEFVCLKIWIRFGIGVTIITLNEWSSSVNVAYPDDLTRSLHSAWSLWRHNRNTIRVLFSRLSLARYFHLLALFFFGNDVRRIVIVSNPRHGSLFPFYIWVMFIEQLLFRFRSLNRK